MKYATLSPRGGQAINDPAQLDTLSSHMHTYDDYGVDNVSVCLGTLPDDPLAYILTRSAERVWAWSFEDPEQAAASFRHFHASPFEDWAYMATDLGLVPLIARHGLLPQLQLEHVAADHIRFYRSAEGRRNVQSPLLLRFPLPADRQIDEEHGEQQIDEDGRVHHNVWLTATPPAPIEIDILAGEDWIPVEEFIRSLLVTTELAGLAAELEDSPSL